MVRRTFDILVGFVLIAMLAETAWAQTFPSHALRMIVNGPPGGPTDLVARMIAARISDSTGQSVVLDNRPGGGSQIAAAQLMQSPADGNTLLVGDIGAFAINASLYPKLSFDPLKDFQPITTLMSSPSVLIVPADSPSNSLEELLERAKSPHGRLTFASAGLGSGAHLIAEMLKMRTGAKLDHVPYNGMPQATHAVVAGQVDLLFQVMGVALPLSKAGKVKVLAIASSARSPRMPDVPTTSELGHAYLRMSPWFGVVTRSGTPQDVVALLHRKVTDALAHPDTTKRLGELGYDPFPNSPEQFGSFMREESERWARVVRASGTRAN